MNWLDVVASMYIGKKARILPAYNPSWSDGVIHKVYLSGRMLIFSCVDDGDNRMIWTKAYDISELKAYPEFSFIQNKLITILYG